MATLPDFASSVTCTKQNTATGDCTWPTTVEQLDLMNLAFEETSITQDNVAGVVGMFGQDDGYYFYMNFQPADDDQWYDGSVIEKNFRILFQMGDTLADWTGVKYTHNTLIDTAGSVELDQISCTNSIKTAGSAQIINDARDNSTFFGSLQWKISTTSAADANVVDYVEVFITRLIEQDE